MNFRLIRKPPKLPVPSFAAWGGAAGEYAATKLWVREPTEGKHFVGTPPIFGPNIRIIPKGFIPFFMEMEVLERRGQGERRFLSPGSSSQDFVLFVEDRSAIVFEDMPLQRDELDPLVALAQAFQDTEVQEGSGQED